MNKIRIINEANEARIELFGEIGQSFWSDGWTLERFRNEIRSLAVPNLKVELKSLGGDVFEAFAIYDEIKQLPARVTVDIIGASASAATIIAAAADKVRISENTQYLVHNARTWAEGTKEQIGKTYEELAAIDNQILNIYIKRTGKDRTALAALMEQDKWMTAQEALQWGFVDEIIPERKKILNSKSKHKQLKSNNMEKFLNLTEEEQAEMDALLAENEALKARVAELEAAMADINAANEKKEEEEIMAEVDEAEKTGKITAEAKPHWVAVGKANRTAMKMALAGIKQAPLNSIPNRKPAAPAQPLDKKQLFENYKTGKITLVEYNEQITKLNEKGGM